MATGDQQDINARLQGYLPPRWFGDFATAPIISALLQGLAYLFAYVVTLINYAKNQTRIATATDAWLDIIAADFFGSNLTRGLNQTDASLRTAIGVNLLRPRATRAGLVGVLVALTGRTPIIIEPRRPLDTGVYGGPYVGYSAAGAYGSMLIPFQAFIIPYRPQQSGIPYVAGYGVSAGGYSQASQAEYATYSQIQGAVADATIYSTIDSVKPAGTIMWARISS